MTEEETGGTAREALRAFIAEQVDGEERTKASELARLAARQFGGDADLIAELIYPAVYQVVCKHMSDTRGGVYLEDLQGRFRSGNSSDEQPEVESVFRRESKYTRWREWNGSEHVKYMRCNRQDLLEAARYRRRMSTTQMIRALVDETVAGKLTADEVVADKFTPEEIEQIERNIIESLDAGRESA